MKCKYICVLDYSNNSITNIMVNPTILEQYETIDDYLIDKGFHLSECSYMVSDTSANFTMISDLK